MLQIDMGAGKPCCGVIFDGKDTVIMAPPVVGYMLEWPRAHVLRYAYLRGWTVREIEEGKS